MGRAAGIPPVRAASVVRVLARVAILIPTNPALPERTAPKTYATAPHGRPQSRNDAISTAITTTNTETQRYSRRRNAIAPSRIAWPISIILGLPSGAARTERA